MKVSELIEKLQNVKNKDSIIIVCDHKGFDLHFADLDVIEGITDPEEVGWEDEPPAWIPKKPFATVTIE